MTIIYSESREDGQIHSFFVVIMLCFFGGEGVSVCNSSYTKRAMTIKVLNRGGGVWWCVSAIED